MRVACELAPLRCSTTYSNSQHRIIADGRLFITVLEGVVIGVGFAAERELKEWGKMPLPKLPNLEQRVAEMEKKGRIRMNFKFVVVKRSG